VRLTNGRGRSFARLDGLSGRDNTLRRQLWVNLASYRTLAVTVSAASPRAGPPGDNGGGSSTIWSDYGRSGRGPGQGPYSAVPLAQAGSRGAALRVGHGAVLQSASSAAHTDDAGANGAWYLAGANAVCAEAPEAAVTAGR